jgi:hypothetical protein
MLKPRTAVVCCTTLALALGAGAAHGQDAAQNFGFDACLFVDGKAPSGPWDNCVVTSGFKSLAECEKAREILDKKKLTITACKPEFNLAKWITHDEPPSHQLDCLKWVEDDGSMFGWLGPLMHIMGCSWLGWTETKANVLPEFTTKSRPGSWPAVFDIEPAKLAEPIEPVEPPGAQGRYTTKVYYDRGGQFVEYYDFLAKDWF